MSIVRVDLECDVFEFILGDLDVVVLVDRVALDDVVVCDFFAALGVDLEVANSVASVLGDLVEAHLVSVRRRRIKGDRTGHQ